MSANAIRNGKGEIITFEVRGRGRFKWPFKQGRMVLLRSDLVRLRSSLHLMATVMMHARELQEKAILDRCVCSIFTIAVMNLIGKQRKLYRRPNRCAKDPNP